MLRRVVSQTLTGVSEVFNVFIIRAMMKGVVDQTSDHITLMMEAVSTCETSVAFCQTARRSALADSNLCTLRRGSH
jgi:hypothetical protein